MSSTEFPSQAMPAVLPLAITEGKEAEDLERAITLVRTLRHFFRRDQIFDLHVVARSADRQRIQDGLLPLAAPWLAITVHDETKLLPILAERKPGGWHAQQIIKMAAPEWLGAPAWLTLDADVICVRPFGVADIMPGGRALIQFMHPDEKGLNAVWLKSCRDVLGLLTPLTFTMHPTPLVYTKPIMQATHALIEARYQAPWIAALLEWEKIQELARLYGHGWAEHTLYFGAAVQTGLLRHLHAVVGIDVPHGLAGNNGMWASETWQQWNPARSFGPDGTGIFEVCNSYTGAPAAFVAEKIQPFLREPEQGAVSPPSNFTPFAAQRLLDHADEVRTTPDKLRARVISTRPLVIAGPYDRTLRSVLSWEVLQPLADLHATFLVSLPSTFSASWDAARLAARIARRTREFPRHNFMVLCNEQSEINLLREFGVPCALVSHNAMICERPFLKDGPDDGLEYDAIYNASFLKLKRHELAAGIDSLALLFADWHDSPETAEQAGMMRELLPRAAFVNQPAPEDEYRFVGRDGVADLLRKSRVGLCLSEAEGALRASIEYLLAGMSVVSTPSIGGRDVFFDPHYCLVVDPTAEAVAAGVAELKRRNVPRAFVRRRTLEKIAVHRQTMVDLVRGLAVQAGQPPVQRYDWPWLDDDAMHKSYDSAGVNRAVREALK